MRIAVFDDSIGKCQKIESECKNRGIETVIMHDLRSAIKFLENNHVDGIVTDMIFPLRTGGKKGKAGNILLKWLLHQDRRIPVLGNSHLDFDSKYPYYYQEKMNGYFQEQIFQNFVSFIENLD